MTITLPPTLSKQLTDHAISIGFSVDLLAETLIRDGLRRLVEGERVECGEREEEAAI